MTDAVQDTFPAGEHTFWYPTMSASTISPCYGVCTSACGRRRIWRSVPIKGSSLALAECAALAIDPNPHIKAEAAIGAKPLCAFYRMTSDAFFTKHDPKAVFGGPIDMAFLDGMHLCEYLLRNFINVERHCRRNSIVILHDCLPVECPMAERKHTRRPIREHHKHSWAGDVWRTALLLKRRRPDLEITAYATPPTGLVCVTNLSPNSTTLADSYAAFVREMMAEISSGVGN